MLQIATQTLESAPAKTDNPGGFTHIPALDGIRGFAILLVLICHLFSANNHTGSRLFDLIEEISEASYCGVNLFFALSGFLITGILFDTRNGPHYFKTFYARRSLRIFPLYYGSLLILLLLTKPFHFVWSGWQYYFLTYTSNLALWRAHIPLRLGVFNINHFWSLQVEEQFYLIWPFVVYRIRRAETIVRISLAGCIVVLCIRIFLVAMRGHAGFDNVYLTYSPTFSCMDNILFGCGLCALLRTPARDTVKRLAPRVLAVTASLILIIGIWNHGFLFQDNATVPTIGFTLVGISCAAVIAMTLRSASRTASFFHSSFLRFFGKYSYGIYVFHYSIAGFANGPIRLFVYQHLQSRALGVFAGAIVVTLLSVFAALLSYHLYEKQFLRLKRFFSYSSASPARTNPQKT